jgi:hypothetical protein
MFATGSRIIARHCGEPPGEEAAFGIGARQREHPEIADVQAEYDNVIGSAE